MLHNLLSLLLAISVTMTSVIPTISEIPVETTTSVTIKMVGDNLIHNSINTQSETLGADILYQNVKESIQSADIAIINQETIFVENEKQYSGYPRFGSSMKIGDALVSAGFDVVAHATNHTVDKGVSGVRQTLDFWNKYPEITVLGIHDSKEDSDVSYMTVNDITLSFVNYTYGLNGLDYEKKDAEYIVDMLSDDDIEETMKDAETSSEFTIAILHVGNEYVYVPSSYAQKQVDRFIDLGADLILCAHPHVVEAYGFRTTTQGNTALVYYSLGNFVSTQNKIPRMLGGMADITITKTKTASKSNIEVSFYHMIPLVTHIENGNITTYFLEEYTDELCKKHKILKSENYTVSKLKALYSSILEKGAHLLQ